MANKPPALLSLGVGLINCLRGFRSAGFSGNPRRDIAGHQLQYKRLPRHVIKLASFVLILFRESIYVALGEEIFFRGLLGGWLVRKFGFALGNILQTLVFLLPHLLLLLISFSLLPILILQTFAGRLLGWLRLSKPVLISMYAVITPVLMYLLCWLMSSPGTILTLAIFRVVVVTGGRLDFSPWELIFYGEFDGKREKRLTCQ